ncbi:Pesticin receptor [Thalassocella blandensis]|nr:Pesticin receptor [Thalassocella blandensis]
MMTFDPIKQLLVVSSVIGCSFSPYVFSAPQQQTQTDDYHGGLEEVLVRAQIREESIFEIPVSVAHISKEFIQATGAKDLSDLEYAIPSLSFGAGTRKSRGEISIRGIGDYSRNIGSDARVVVYVDGVPYVRSSTFNVALLDVQQVEVIRGPQGTFFGTNSVAGAINITTHKPHEEASQSMQLEIGNYNTRNANLFANIPLNDRVMGSLELGRQQSDGYIDNIYQGKEIQGVDNNAARIKLKILPSDKLDIDISLDWLEEDVPATNGEALQDNSSYSGYSEAPEPLKVSHDTDEYEKRSVAGGSVSASYATDADFTIVSTTALRDNEFSTQNEEDYSSVPASYSYFNEQSQQASQELRLISPLYDKFNYIVGAFYMSQSIETARFAQLGENRATTPGKLDHDSASLYGHLNYVLNEHWQTSIGARFVEESKAINYTIEDGIGLFVNDTLITDKTFSDFLPKFGIQYTAHNDGMLYFNVSKSFKSGGWNADFVTDLSSIEFKPEYAYNWELGYKQELLDNNLNFNVALFQINIEDLQVFQFVESDTATILQLTNAGEATSRGLELELNYLLDDHWKLTLNSAYTDAKFDEFKNGGRDSEGNFVNYDTHQLSYAPKLKYFLGLDYTYKHFYGHLNYSYSSSFYSNPSNSDSTQVPSCDTINSRVGLKLNSHWQFELWGNNLADSRHLRYREESFLRIDRGFYEEPRSFGISIMFKN